MTDKSKAKATPAIGASEHSAQHECFVIMPISEVQGYQPDHFRRVYEDIFVPACTKAGYKAIRADEVAAANLIQLDILKRLLTSPIVLCDLSTRNPNVLFELALRMAFDKPVILVQQYDNPKIFDITGFRITSYYASRQYHEVLHDQELIAAAIREIAAADKDENINSIIHLLKLSQAAQLVAPQQDSKDAALQLLLSEVSSLTSTVTDLSQQVSQLRSQTSYAPQNYLATLPIGGGSITPPNKGSSSFTLQDYAELAKAGRMVLELDNVNGSNSLLNAMTKKPES